MRVICVSGMIVIGMWAPCVMGGEPAANLGPVKSNTSTSVVAQVLSRPEVQPPGAAGVFQRRLEHVKKQIADRQVATEKLSQMLADRKNEGMRPLLEKQVEFGTKQLALLRDLQVALEKQDQGQVDRVFGQLQDVSTAWSVYGEVEARMEVERARAKKLMEEHPGAEVKSAWDAYTAASDEMLAALRRKQALEKEMRDLDAKQREAMQKLRLEVQSSLKKSGS